MVGSFEVILKNHMPKLKKDKKRPGVSPKRKILNPIPNFICLKEEAHFRDTHDTTEYALDDLDETVGVAGPLKASVEKRRAERLAVLEKVKEYLIAEVGNMVQQMLRTLEKMMRRVPVLVYADPVELRKKGVRHVAV